MYYIIVTAILQLSVFCDITPLNPQWTINVKNQEWLHPILQNNFVWVPFIGYSKPFNPPSYYGIQKWTLDGINVLNITTNTIVSIQMYDNLWSLSYTYTDQGYIYQIDQWDFTSGANSRSVVLPSRSYNYFGIQNYIFASWSKTSMQLINGQPFGILYSGIDKLNLNGELMDTFSLFNTSISSMIVQDAIYTCYPLPFGSGVVKMNLDGVVVFNVTYTQTIKSIHVYNNQVYCTGTSLFKIDPMSGAILTTYVNQTFPSSNQVPTFMLGSNQNALVSLWQYPIVSPSYTKGIETYNDTLVDNFGFNSSAFFSWMVVGNFTVMAGGLEYQMEGNTQYISTTVMKFNLPRKKVISSTKAMIPSYLLLFLCIFM